MYGLTLTQSQENAKSYSNRSANSSKGAHSGHHLGKFENNLEFGYFVN
jgi:hypothetical protein